MTIGRPKALIIDDEKAIRRFVRSVLVAEDFDVVEAETLAAARREAAAERPDLVVLDLGLPDGDGAALIREFASAFAPAIIVLSAYHDEARKVGALDAGAHDFVTKPFGVAEFMARVRAAMRHRLHERGAAATYDDGRLSMDFSRRIVRVVGVDPKLTPREFDILQALASAPGRVITHTQLIKQFWDGDADVQTLRVHIRNLRRKIEINPEMPALVVTEPGVGYRFLGTQAVSAG